jgi:hypothetical protein
MWSRKDFAGSWIAGVSLNGPAIHRSAACESRSRASRQLYDDERTGLGARFLADVQQVFTRIRETPKQFPVVDRKIRRALLHAFPYAVYFRETDDSVVVLTSATKTRPVARPVVRSRRTARRARRHYRRLLHWGRILVGEVVSIDALRVRCVGECPRSLPLRWQSRR